jgi:AcrR family transcriptional regulator
LVQRPIEWNNQHIDAGLWSFEMGARILRPTTPPDIGQRTQRQRIINAMIESCEEKTYAATTISDIVARARISRTTFYKQFDDKRACFDSAIVHCIEQLGEVAGESHSAEDSPADAARKAAGAVLEAMAAQPGLAQLLAGDAVAVDPKAVDRYRKAAIPALEALWASRGVENEKRGDANLAFGQAQVLILQRVTAGEAKQLPEILPEIAYLAVAPFGGHEEAVRQGNIARGTENGDGAGTAG